MVPKVLIWLENRHLEYFNVSKRIDSDHETVIQEVDNTRLQREHEGVVFHSMWLNWVQACEGACLEVYQRCSIGRATLRKDDERGGLASLCLLLVLSDCLKHSSSCIFARAIYEQATQQFGHVADSGQPFNRFFGNKTWWVHCHHNWSVQPARVVAYNCTWLVIRWFPFWAKVFFVAEWCSLLLHVQHWWDEAPRVCHCKRNPLAGLLGLCVWQNLTNSEHRSSR